MRRSLHGLTGSQVSTVLEREPTLDDVPESQRHRVCFCKVADGRMHLRGSDCDAVFTEAEGLHLNPGMDMQ